MTKVKIKTLLLILIVSVCMTGCFIVKEKETEDYTHIVNISPKPEIEMGDEIVRSKIGDMIAFLPKDWSFIDVEEKAPGEVFAVAVNQDYTLSAVFSEIRKNPNIEQIVDKEGLFGLTRVCLEKHQNKTAGAVKQIGKSTTINIGPLQFGKYEFSATGGAINTQAAVFISSVNQYYEFALIPMDFRAKPLPSQDEIDKIFRSILATVQY
jgi:hypothetical protein